MKELTQGNVVKLEAGEHLEGLFLSVEQSEMYKDSYALKVKDGDEVKVTFVNNIVKDLLESNGVKPMTKIRVLYKGMVKNKEGSRSYKDYSVLVD